MKQRGVWHDFDHENPENNGIEDGEQVVVLQKGYGINFLTYNETYQVFDDAEGDDFYCKFDKIEKYLLIPNIDN